MPRLTEKSHIRAILSADRPWAVYALGDLAADFFEHTTWFGADDGTALLMLYSGFGTPLLFALGAAERVDGLLNELVSERDVYLSIRPDILPLIKRRYSVSGETPMWRMILNPGRFREVPGPAVRLGIGDVAALERLHAGAEDAPDFFSADMVAQGVYYGAFGDDGDLAAAAGTHLVVGGEGVAAVGNVYVRPDRRGRGLGTLVTSAVVVDLLARSELEIIALNVRQDNAAAVAVYERLGFERFCAFYEGRARR